MFAGKAGVVMKKNRFGKRHILILSVVIIALAVSVFFIVRSNGDSKGYRTISIIEVFGNVSVVKDGIEYSAYTGMMLKEGHEIVTNGNSYVRMVLDDDKYVKLESGSRAVFETLGILDSGKTRIRLERGSLTSEIVNPLSADEEFVINTPNAVLSVRGTFFRVDLGITENGDITSDVMTYGGKVASKRVMPTGETIEEEVLIDAGYKATINMTKEDTHYLVENESGDKVIVEPVKPEDSDNPQENIILPTQQIKVEEVPDDDLVDMYFAAENGHEMFVDVKEAKATIEERAINLEEKKSVYVIAVETAQEKADVVANDSKPIAMQPIEEETEENTVEIVNPLIDGDAHIHTEVPGGIEKCHSKCGKCNAIISSEHTFIQEVSIEPTCYDKGEMVHICECGYSYTTEIAATGHSAVNGGTTEGHVICDNCKEVLDGVHIYTEEVTLEATCTDMGVMTHTCECGYSYTTDIPAIGHTEIKGSTADSHISCQTCGAVISSEHIYTETVTREATCVVNGEILHTCECGYSYTTVIPSTVHSEEYVGTANAHSKCSVCGDVVSATHSYMDAVTIEPTCTETGITTHTCDCGYSYTTEIAANGHTTVKGGIEGAHFICDVCDTVLSTAHNYTSVVTLEPTCTETGIITHTCDCGYSYTTEIAANGHTTVNGGTEGAHFICDVCDTVLSTAHSYTSEVKEPTCVLQGETKYTCDCGYSYTKPIDANGHLEETGGTASCHTKCSVCGETLSDIHTLDESVVIAATCKSDGKLLHACECGYEYTTTISQTGHTKSEDKDVTTCVTCGDELIELNSNNFPDSALLTYLTGDGIDLYGDNMLDGDELALINKLTIPEQVTDTTGIGLLSAMTELDLSNNSTLTSVIVSGSKSTSLAITGDKTITDLTITDSDTIATLDLSGVSSVTNLDVSGMSALSSVDITAYNLSLQTYDISGSGITDITINNFRYLQGLNAADCISLKNVDIYSGRNFGTIDLSGCTELTTLRVESTYISAIDLSDNTKLTTLNLGNSYSLAEVDLTGLADLTNLNISYCSSIAEVDLTGLTKLETLNVGSTQIASLDTTPFAETLKTLSVAGCTSLSGITWPADDTTMALESISIGSSSITSLVFNENFEKLSSVNASFSALQTFEYVAGATSALSTLNFSDCSTIESITIEDANYVVPLESLSLIGSESIKEISLSGLSSLRSLELGECTALESLTMTECYGDLGDFYLSGCTALTTLYIENCSGIVGLGIEDCVMLSELTFKGTNATSLDLTNNTALVNLVLSGSNFTGEFDYTHLTQLETLDLSNITGITSIDVSNITTLTSLDLSGCTAVEKIIASYCTSLSTINFSANALTHFCIEQTPYTGNHTAVGNLSFYGNKVLQVIKIDGSTGITCLQISQADALVEVTVSNCLALTQIHTTDTTATYTIDASTCTNLTTVSNNSAGVTIIQP